MKSVSELHTKHRQLRSPPPPGRASLADWSGGDLSNGGRGGALTEHQSLLGLACH